MTAENVIDSILRLVGLAASWPVVILIITVLFRKSISMSLKSGLPRLMHRLTKASVGSTSVEFQADAIALSALRETVESDVSSGSRTPEEALAYTLEQVRKASGLLAPQEEEHLRNRSILWVDDRPSNVIYETNVFKRMGARVIFARSTDEAIEYLDVRQFDLIISDLHRLEDGVDRPHAGFDLLRRLSSRDESTPLAFYTKKAETASLPLELVAYGAPMFDLSRDLLVWVMKNLSSKNE